MTGAEGTPQAIDRTLFDADESAGWKELRSRLSDEVWESAYQLLWDFAPRITDKEEATAFLFDAYERLEHDFDKADALLLLARVSMTFPEDHRADIYQRMVSLEATANTFLRSKILQLTGLFAHILDNSMLVAGQLAGRRLEANVWCAMAHVRAIKRAYLVRPDPILERAIGRYEQHQEAIVCAEARLQMASIRLVQCLSSKDRTELVGYLDDAVAMLDTVERIAPGRPDVASLLVLTDACRALTATPIDRATLAEAAARLRQLWRRARSDDDGSTAEGGDLESEWVVVEAVERVAALLKQVESLPSALDGTAGLVAIAEAAVFLQGLADVGLGSGSASELGMSVLVRQGYQHYVESYVKRSLWTGLQHAKIKIQTLLTGDIAATKPEAAAYLTGVLDVFADIEAGRTSRFDTTVLMTLARALPTKRPDEIEHMLIEHQSRGTLPQFLVEIFGNAPARASLPEVREYLGGYPKAQRILRRVHDDLAGRLADQLPPDTLANFMNVLTHVLGYLFAATERKLPVPFLMSKFAGGKGEDAVEGDLEDALHLFLLNSNIAFAVRRQPNMATGRVDLSVHFGEIVFPIEVKREKSDLSHAHLRDEYLAQAATYTRAYDRLGLFLVLDLTTKPKGEPLVDLENLVWVVEMVPRVGTTTLPVTVPDYLVTVVVPGNQPRPSDLSSYS